MSDGIDQQGERARGKMKINILILCVFPLYRPIIRYIVEILTY